MENIKNGSLVGINLFGKEKKVEVFSADYKEKGDKLSKKELECLNWFIENINIDNYKREITEYCNEQYKMIGETQITEENLENEVCIFAIAINADGIPQSLDGFVYPEIAFYGDCECDPEHGICIGFRDKEFLGVGSQDWIL